MKYNVCTNTSKINVTPKGVYSASGKITRPYFNSTSDSNHSIESIPNGNSIIIKHSKERSWSPLIPIPYQNYSRRNLLSIQASVPIFQRKVMTVLLWESYCVIQALLCYTSTIVLEWYCYTSAIVLYTSTIVL